MIYCFKLNDSRHKNSQICERERQNIYKTPQAHETVLIRMMYDRKTYA